MCYFFFNDTATTEIYTLSLHDALPIFNEPEDVLMFEMDELGLAGCRYPCADLRPVVSARRARLARYARVEPPPVLGTPDRKSTRLNSSHANISYAVFCLKKKK